MFLPTKVVHNFHQSDLSDVDFCPERGRRRLQEGMESEPTDSTVKGTAVHAAAEYGLFEKRDAAYGPELKDLEMVFEHELLKLCEVGFKWTKYKAADDLLKAGRKAVAAWHREVMPQVEPDVIEAVYSRPIVVDDERIIVMEGSPDCVDTSGVCWDWKTGSRQYREWEYQKQAIQPTVYSFLAQFDKPLPWHFRYAIMRDNGTVDYCNVTRNEADHRWLREKVLNLAITLEAGLPRWPVNDQGWWCSEKWCPAWRTCKGQALSSNVPVTQGGLT